MLQIVAGSSKAEGVSATGPVNIDAIQYDSLFATGPSGYKGTNLVAFMR
tara:strand:- start:198 stop:344 length:147 start_codon:yes stop_codon:yes gene_type:complete